MSGILKVGGSELINDNGGSGALQWGSGVPSGSIVQVKHYTFTSVKSFTGVNSGAYRWITDSIKGGSSDYITFDNPIKSGNHV